MSYLISSQAGTQEEKLIPSSNSQGAEVIPFTGSRDVVSRGEIADAVKLWRLERDLSDALTRQEIGAMRMLDRIDAQRKALIIGFAEYLRKHERSDVAMGVYLVSVLMSDNDQGMSTVSQPTLAKLFKRSVSSIADAQRRLREDKLITMSRGRKAGTVPVIPRFVAKQYNHLTWVLAALCDDAAPVNHLLPPDDCQSSGQTGCISKSLGGTGCIPNGNHPVEAPEIIRPDPMQFQSSNSTILEKAVSAVAVGLASTLAVMPAAAKPEDPPAIVLKAKPSLAEMSDRMMRASGKALASPATNPSLLVMSELQCWLSNGCDFELDIIPTIEAISRRANGGSIGTWRYFTKAIANAKATRLAPMPAGEAQTKTRPSWRPKTKDEMTLEELQIHYDRGGV
jgi:hypothetical protein